MSTDAQPADTQSARLKELFWATVFGAGEEQLSALLAELKSWGTELESIILSRAAVAEQAQAEASPEPRQLRRSVQAAEQGAGAGCDPPVRAIRHEAFQGQAGGPDWDLALAPARSQQRRPSRDNAASALPQDGAGQEPVQGGAESKPCKCKKSRCLKLYCDCFATGHFCNEACFCMDCQNRTSSAPIVFKARTFTLARDPTAFQPKVAGSAAHVKGCQCRKSRCLKKYCECYLGGVACTEACRCMNCLNKEPRAGGEGPSAEEAGVGAPADQDMEAADDAPAAAAPRRQLHLDQELFLADPAIDSSASLEGASAKQPRFVGGVASMSGTSSGDDTLVESAPAGAQLQPRKLGKSAAVRVQAAPHARDWAAGQSAGTTSANSDDPSMADDATSPPPRVSRRNYLSRCARAPMNPQRSINPTQAALPAGEPAREEGAAQAQMGKRRRHGMRINTCPSPQPSPGKKLAYAALHKRMDLMPAAWRPVLMEVHGNTAGRSAVPENQDEVL